jgi:hypothetical protein
MRELKASWSEFPERDHPEYYEKAMDAGNRLRDKLQDGSVLARLAIAMGVRTIDPLCRQII